MKLSHFTQGRDNNFNLIRIVAALAVLMTHSFALAIGTGDAEPLRKSLGMGFGQIAVHVFFITSGFLVTASLFNRQSTIEFIWARVLRIFPALLANQFLTVFVLGVFFTSLPLSVYFSDVTTYTYLLKNSTLFAGVTFNLPGVFDSNPYKSAVNRSLWTMPHEVRMYAILVFVYFVLRITRKNRLKAFKLSILIYAVLSGSCVLFGHFYYLPVVSSLSTFVMLSFMFFTGATFYVLKEHILLKRSFFWLIIIILAFSIINKHIFYVVYILSIAYLLFFLAYVPCGYIRKYNLLGDYSYGIYIYAHLVQQSVAALIPGVSVAYMMLISAPISILFAAMSWHLLERRALSLKEHYIGHTRKLLRFS